ncbi:hypothetical protein TBC1_12953 [Lentimicrobium saccharophilum]|uniref:Uncharacterized protein n=1 Tax=Lentimicrobium saccharophilum TaxID=1678841 RepID=A0A0S7BX12_9BACT|nr:hypothetical protein TBC1_12953 [Lentimicrobium saccharophilum]
MLPVFDFRKHFAFDKQLINTMTFVRHALLPIPEVTDSCSSDGPERMI